MDPVWTTVLVALVGVERLVELAVAERNRRWSLARGGVEHGQGHYPVMVLLHTALLVGVLVEVWWLRPQVPLWLGIVGAAGVVVAQALRWWCIATLGRQWTTRVVVVPGLGRVEGGPYRLVSHPNYVAVVLEGLALPLAGGALITAVLFTVANAALLRVRIRVEDRALASLDGASA